MAGPIMAYTVDGLQRGGAAAGSAGTVAEAASTTLRGVECPPAEAFGDVRGAALLAAAFARARDGHARTGVAVADHHKNLAGRAGTVAGQGGQLTVETAAVAAQGGAG